MFSSSPTVVLMVAVVTMLAQQTMATVAKTAVPVLFKAVADELGFDAELVLLYTWVFACVGIVVMLGCGAFIIRFGALRISQVGCVLMGIGLGVAAAAIGSAWTALTVLCVASIAISIGSTAATPASSQILARYAPLRWAPLVFSVKQTGVPAGVVIASFLAPALALAFGWRMAALVLALSSVAIAVSLQPFVKEFDRDRNPSHPLKAGGIKATLYDVLANPSLRLLAASAFAFVGLQSIYTNFTVVYLAEELDYDLTRAGAALGFATLVAAPGRILWGWVGSAWLSPRAVLAGLAVVMALGAGCMGLFDRSWSYPAIMVPLIIVSATALSWHGVLLAEVSRECPGAEVGRMTGGVLAFGTAGQIVAPLIFWAGFLLGGYPGAYIAAAVPPATMALVLMMALGSPRAPRQRAVVPPK